jgi:hypothetical protein
MIESDGEHQVFAGCGRPEAAMAERADWVLEMAG